MNADGHADEDGCKATTIPQLIFGSCELNKNRVILLFINFIIEITSTKQTNINTKYKKIISSQVYI